jgi:protein TonB
MEIRESPELELSYVVLEKKEEQVKKPTPPKKVKKAVKKEVEKPNISKTVAPVEESEPTEEIADIKSGQEVIDTIPTVLEVSQEEPQPTSIEGAESLDNTSFSPIFNPKPVYPTVARRNRITGYVDLDLTISKKGKVEDYKVVKWQGHPLFPKEIAKVIFRWRFPPPRLKGKKVAVIYRYRVKFRLN